MQQRVNQLKELRTTFAQYPSINGNVDVSSGISLRRQSIQLWYVCSLSVVEGFERQMFAVKKVAHLFYALIVFRATGSC